MLIRVNVGDADSMPDDAFMLVDWAAQLPSRLKPGGFEEDVPADAGELVAKLSETDEVKATGVLVWLMSTTMVYGGRGRYEEAKARDVAKALARLLGRGARWWTAWEPVTRHTMDAVVVGTGGGVIVTIVAFDDD